MSKKERVKGKGADIFFSEDKEETEEQSREVRDPLKAESARSLPTQAQDYTGREELATKATFYFTQSQLDALEKAVFLLKQEYRIKTNKSEVMRIACEEVTKDFLENRRDSALLKRLGGNSIPLDRPSG